jgi:hypothetical protein
MRYILAIFVSVLLASNAFCEDDDQKKPVLAFAAGVGVMRGHTTYQIGGNFDAPDDNGNVRFPISELEFPLDVAYGSLGAQLDVAGRLEIAGGFKKNISEDAGELKDRDWGTLHRTTDWWHDPNSLDVFSVSDTKLNALVAEVSARFYANPWQYKKTELKFYLGGKYTYQKFDFTADNLDQWYPSLNEYYGVDVGHIRISGEVLTYEVIKEIPAVMAGLKLATAPSITFDITLGYSPHATVKDEDNHLLRPLVSKAKCDGEALMFSLTGEVLLFPRCAFNVKYDYTTIDTKGVETQYHPRGRTAEIEQKNFSDVHMYEITMAYRF